MLFYQWYEYLNVLNILWPPLHRHRKILSTRPALSALVWQGNARGADVELKKKANRHQAPDQSRELETRAVDRNRGKNQGNGKEEQITNNGQASLTQQLTSGHMREPLFVKLLICVWM